MAKPEKAKRPLSGSRAVIAGHVVNRNLTHLSTQLGRNASYLQQHLRYATPRVLPEKERRSLAAILGVNEETLRESSAQEPSLVSNPFEITPGISVEVGNHLGVMEIDIRKGYDQTDFSAGSLRSDAEWSLPRSFVEKELRTQSGSLVISTYEGHGLEPKLVRGDRIIIDRSLKTASPEGLFLIADSSGLCVRSLAFVPGSDPLKIEIVNEENRQLSVCVPATAFEIIGRVVSRISRI